uniref:2-oxoacid:acceptor oxidoreductase subunit alpha n=1 Tax=Fervidobacterium thailandense TaxID=1008305 RepID=A0A7C4CF58_9BACT
MPKSSRMVFWQGNEACAYGAIRAGCRFYAGYPITPSSEIAEVMARELPKVGGVFVQMEDEIASAAAIIGASLAGVKSMTATSGPGFSLMQEAIGYAIMTETPTVFVDVMRAGPSTGMPTKPSQGDIMQARWGTHGDHAIIALYPSTVEEVYRYTIKAFNLAEEYRTPVILLMDEVLGHMYENFYLPPDNEIEIVERISSRELEEGEIFVPFSETEYAEHLPPTLVEMGKAKFHVSGLVHDESGFPMAVAETAERLIRRLVNKIKLHIDKIAECEEYMLEDAESVIIAYGTVARSAKEAVNIARAEGIKVGLLRPITIWPIPVNQMRKKLANVQNVLVAEMNLGQYASEVVKLVKPGTKLRVLSRVNGELIAPHEILDELNNMLLEGVDF